MNRRGWVSRWAEWHSHRASRLSRWERVARILGDDELALRLLKGQTA